MMGPKVHPSSGRADSRSGGKHGRTLAPSRMLAPVGRWSSVAVAIVVCLVVAAGFALESTATAHRIAPARAGAALVSSGFTPVGRSEESLQQYARINTWYSSYNPAFPWTSTSSYVHFKTVDADGYTVKEALGSDNIDLNQETTYLVENPQRRALVDELRAMMQADGWTELGVDGDWYEYAFTR